MYFSVSGNRWTTVTINYVSLCQAQNYIRLTSDDLPCSDLQNCVINLDYDSSVSQQFIPFSQMDYALPINTCRMTTYKASRPGENLFSEYAPPFSTGHIQESQNGKYKMVFDHTDDIAIGQADILFKLWGLVPGSIPEVWVPIIGDKSIKVIFIIPPACSDAIITASYIKKEWILDADPDKEHVIDWKYFTLITSQNDAAYNQLDAQEQFPTFTSSIPNCDVQFVSVFKNKGSTQAYTKSDPVTQLILSSSPPSIKIKIERIPKFKKSFFIKASNIDQQNAVVELAITICGAEKISSSKQTFVFDQYSLTDDLQYKQISFKSLIDSVKMDFSNSRANSKCSLIEEKTKLWTDDKCESSQLDEFNGKQIAPMIDSNKDDFIKVDTSDFFETQTLFVSFISRGLVSRCTPINISVNKVCLPISFKEYSDEEIMFTFQSKTGLMAINIENQLELNKTKGCPITSFSISQVETLEERNNYVYENDQLIDLNDELSQMVWINNGDLVVDTELIVSEQKNSIIIGASQDEASFAYTKIILRFVMPTIEEKETNSVMALDDQQQVNSYVETQVELKSITKIDQGFLENEQTIQSKIEQESIKMKNIDDKEESYLNKQILESKKELQQSVKQLSPKLEETLEIGEWRPNWFIKSKATPVQVQNLLPRRSAGYWEETKDIIEEPEIWITRITRDQKIDFVFNQQLVVPKFAASTRLLRSQNKGLQVNQVDLTRDIFEIKFVLNSDVDPKDIQYTLNLIEWTEKGLKLDLNCTDPLFISQGEYRDSFVVVIKDRKWFQSSVTGQVLPPQNIETNMDFPIQLQKGVSEEKIVNDAKACSGSMTSIMIIKVIMSVFIKGTLDDIWILFLTMQIVAYLNIYDTKVPAEVSIYVEEFRNIVSFQTLKPDFFIQKVLGVERKPDYAVQITGSLQDSGQGQNVLKNLGAYLFVAFAFVITLILVYMCSKMKFIKREAKILKNKILKQTFFNNTIRSITLSYIETAIQIKVLHQTKPESSQIHQFAIFLVSYVVIITYVVLQFREKLDLEKVRQICDRLYPDIKLNKEYLTVLYYPIFMLRRLIFVVIVILFQGYGGVQIQFLAFLNSLYLLWYAGMQPHNQRKLVLLELVNEVLFMMMIYHLFTFTKFTDIQMHQHMGLSYLVNMGIIISFNVGYVLYNQTLKLLARRRRKMIQKLQHQRIEIAIQVSQAQKLIQWKIDIQKKLLLNVKGHSKKFSKVTFEKAKEEMSPSPREFPNKSEQTTISKRLTGRSLSRRNKFAAKRRIALQPILETIGEDLKGEKTFLEASKDLTFTEPEIQDLKEKISSVNGQIDDIFFGLEQLKRQNK